MALKAQQLRCAIYTRKSSEEGLEQEFNSLDAQYEASASYIASQRHEGWVLVDKRYDDGGISGGTMERPALQRLLEDIRQYRVDVVVVYKVDRLTRALSDFAKMVEIFDANGASFVSVTQQFNTTTSIGRLTLNVLLSFAQFEREVTGERIRDKIAASKRRGMWMGGHIPLGYDAIDRKLIINEAEAETVRRLFELYRDKGSAPAAQEAASRLGLRTKQRRRNDGSTTGGTAFGRGHLYQILSNPIYVGDIRHKNNVYRGDHAAIIDRALWQAVQGQLANNRVKRRNGTHAKEPSLLAGLLFDSDGKRFTPSHSVKNGHRYRYYVDRQLIVDQSNGKTRGRRIAAAEIEDVFVATLRDFLQYPDQLIAAIDTEQIAPSDLSGAIGAAANLATDLGNSDGRRKREIIRTLLARVLIGDNNVRLEISDKGVSKLLGLPAVGGDDIFCHVDVPIQIRMRRGELKIVMTEGDPSRHWQPDPALIKVIVRAHDWWERLMAGAAVSTADIARDENVSRRYVNQLLPLAFLAPAISNSVLEGAQPVELTVKTLSNRPAMPHLWAEQQQLLGFK